MAVIRVNKTKDYTVMSNIFLREKEMSLKAKGLLALMFSLPDDWDYSISGLTTLVKDGKDSVMNVLKELEKFGYLKRTRTTDERGRFTGYDYDIFESPYSGKSTTDKSLNGNPKEDKPYSEKPLTENLLQLNTNKQNTKELNTNRLNTNKQKADSDVEISEECKSVSYKVIEYLNKKANTSYKPEYKPTLKLIQHRLSEGFTVQDFIKVIDNKYNTWTGTEFQQYLRPSTLFGEKFEIYLNEQVCWTSAKKSDIKAKGERIAEKYSIFLNQF